MGSYPCFCSRGGREQSGSSWGFPHTPSGQPSLGWKRHVIVMVVPRRVGSNKERRFFGRPQGAGSDKGDGKSEFTATLDRGTRVSSVGTRTPIGTNVLGKKTPTGTNVLKVEVQGPQLTPEDDTKLTPSYCVTNILPGTSTRKTQGLGSRWGTVDTLQSVPCLGHHGIKEVDILSLRLPRVGRPANTLPLLTYTHHGPCNDSWFFHNY